MVLVQSPIRLPETQQPVAGALARLVLHTWMIISLLAVHCLEIISYTTMEEK